MSHRFILRAVAGEQREQWDDFVNEHAGGHLLQSWGWGELKAGAGWHPQRFALWDDDCRRIVAAAQVLCRSLPHLPLRAGHLAYIPRGPVIDWSQPALCTSFFAQLQAVLRRQGTLTLLIEPERVVSVAGGAGSAGGAGVEKGSLSEDFAAFLVRPARPIQPLRTILLNLTPDEETLLARMKEKWRYNVRLAGRKGVTVRVAATPDDVRAWYALLQTTGERDQFGVHTLDYYLSAWQILAPRNQGRLLLAEYDGQLLAGIFVGLFAKEGIYLYGASGNVYRNLMPNYLLQWEAIRWAKQQGATRYDFWGIPETDDMDEAMAGVYRFKSGWGGEVVRFVGCYEHLLRPRAMRLARKLLPERL
jgi:lipid II:glycine glycyltransferase (peptidoglycan interpeptide bridge formation enzyme)